MSDPSKLSFEESIQRLSKIVEQLEEGELPLEESLALFEEGIRLTRLSQARLDAAERRIEELLEVSSEGEPLTRPMSLREGLPRLRPRDERGGEVTDRARCASPAG